MRPAPLLNRSILALSVLALLASFAARPLRAQDDPDQRPNPPEVQKAHEDSFEEGEGKESEFVRKRMQWFHDQRAYPNKLIPPGVRQRAIKDRDRRTASRRRCGQPWPARQPPLPSPCGH